MLWILGTCAACVSIPPPPASSPSPPAPEAVPLPAATPAPGQTRPDSRPAQSTPAGKGQSAGPGASPETPSPGESSSQATAPSGGPAPGATAIFVPSGTTPDDITPPRPEESRPPAGSVGSATALPAPSPPGGTFPAGLTLSVAVGPEIVSVGDSVTVEIVAASSAGVVDAPLHLGYDPGRLRFLEATEGDYMKKDGGGTVFMVNGRSRPGDVAIGIGRKDRSRGVVGSGTLCRVRFEVLAPGTARLAIGPAMAWTIDGSLLPVTTNAAEIQVRDAS